MPQKLWEEDFHVVSDGKLYREAPMQFRWHTLTDGATVLEYSSYQDPDPPYAMFWLRVPTVVD